MHAPSVWECTCCPSLPVKTIQPYEISQCFLEKPSDNKSECQRMRMQRGLVLSLDRKSKRGSPQEDILGSLAGVHRFRIFQSCFSGFLRSDCCSSCNGTNYIPSDIWTRSVNYPVDQVNLSSDDSIIWREYSVSTCRCYQARRISCCTAKGLIFLETCANLMW